MKVIKNNERKHLRRKSNYVSPSRKFCYSKKISTSRLWKGLESIDIGQCYYPSGNFLLLNLNSYPSSSFPFSCYSHGFFKCLRIPLIHNKVVHDKNKKKEPCIMYNAKKRRLLRNILSHDVSLTQISRTINILLLHKRTIIVRNNPKQS